MLTINGFHGSKLHTTVKAVLQANSKQLLIPSLTRTTGLLSPYDQINYKITLAQSGQAKWLEQYGVNDFRKLQHASDFADTLTRAFYQIVKNNFGSQIKTLLLLNSNLPTIYLIPNKPDDLQSVLSLSHSHKHNDQKKHKSQPHPKKQVQLKPNTQLTRNHLQQAQAQQKAAIDDEEKKRQHQQKKQHEITKQERDKLIPRENIKRYLMKEDADQAALKQPKPKHHRQSTHTKHFEGPELD